MEIRPWAAVTVEPDGAISVYVHNWIKAGTARNPEELWNLVLAGWHKPGKFWDLFYQEMGQRLDHENKLKSLTIDDLGI